MDGSRFDRLARIFGTRPSRRNLVGGVLAGLVTGFRGRVTAADDTGGTAIVDASGGDSNLSGQTTPVRRGPGPEPCQPRRAVEVCQGRCNRVVADGCGGKLRCECAAGAVCGPGDLCCPEVRLCLPSNLCCPEGSVCAPGGGVCCAPDRVCTVGGVVNACCAGVCFRGVCLQPT